MDIENEDIARYHPLSYYTNVRNNITCCRSILSNDLLCIPRRRRERGRCDIKIEESFRYRSYGFNFAVCYKELGIQNYNNE